MDDYRCAYDVSRFIIAQKRDYETALREIQSGQKRTHWMWYMFPQIIGIGRSRTSQYYALRSIEEAIAFLEDPYLSGNLREISQALLNLDTNNAAKVLGMPDDLKLKSSMTLFLVASNHDSLFQAVLDKFFSGKPDYRTLQILDMLAVK